MASNRIFDESNIVASCGSTSGKTCGHARSSRSLPVELDLYKVKNIQQHFRVLADGMLTVEESGNLSTAATESIKNAVNIELKLNNKLLKTRRERRMAEINNLLQGGLTVADVMAVYRERDFLSHTEQVCSV